MTSDHKKYSTRGMRSQDTVASWRGFLDQVYYGHDVSTFDDGGIRGLLEKRVFGEMGVSRHQATAHTISRTSELVKVDKAEQHAFIFPLSGIFSCRQRNKEVNVRAGGLYILNASEPFGVHTSNGASSVCVTVPSDVARSYINGVDDKCCAEMVGEPSFTSAMASLIHSIIDKGSEADGSWLRDICCSLLDVTLNPRHARSDGGRRWQTSVAARQLLLENARRIIDGRLHDREFGVGEAADACRVSLRHLQVAFQAVGSTFGRELLKARLERAAGLLRSTTRGAMQIAQIADACGFSSAAHFSTRYRERYGISPRDEAPPIDE